MKYLMITIWLTGSLIYGQNQYISLDKDISYKEVYEVGGLVYKKSDSSLVNSRVVKFNKKTAKKYINVYNGKPSSSGWIGIPKNKSSNFFPLLNNIIDAGLGLASDTPFVPKEGNLNPSNEIHRIYKYRYNNADNTEVKQESTTDSGLSPLIEGSNLSEGRKAYLNKEQNLLEVIDNGAKINYYSNGAIMNKTNYLNSKKEGLSTNYYPNGLIENKVHYTKGKKTGAFEAFYENGQLQALLKYVDGKEEGACKFYYENGKLFISGFFIKGVQNNLWVYHNEEGVFVKNEVYRNGELISEKKY